MTRSWRAVHEFLPLVVDVTLTEVALGVAQRLRHVLPFGMEIVPDKVYVTPAVLILVAGIWSVVFHLWGVYRADRPREDLVHTWKRLVPAVTFSCFTLASTFYFLKIQDFSRAMFLYFYLLDLALILGARALIGSLQKGGAGDARRLLIIGGGLRPELAEQIARWPGYNLIGFLGELELPATIPTLGPVSAASEVIRRQAIDEVIITPASWERGDLANLVLDLREQAVRIRVAPDILEIVTRAPVDEVGGLPLIDIREPAIGGFQRLVKRSFDFAGATVGLLAAAPLMATIAAAIKMDSEGPVLFVQERAGRHGKPFKMYKFRSMVVGAEEMLDQFVDLEALDQPAFKLRDDPRITRIGRILRYASLDELPQLINVLKGEMSLVGPRPEEVRLVERYTTWQRQRLRVKPGITGAMQVSGRGDLRLDERVKLELTYIEDYSLWKDIKILIRTIPAVIRRRGAY